MALTTVDKVRLLSNLTTSNVSDGDVTDLIAEATKEIVPKISVKVVREKIGYIDETRENDVDGSNTTFYVKNWKGKFIADQDLDGSVDESDVIVYSVASDGTETELTVSSVTHDEGKFVLSSAPTSDKDLYVSYSWSYVDQSTPDERLNLAATFLTIAYCYAKINIGRAVNVRFGSIDLTRHMESFAHYYNMYKMQISEINSQAVSGWTESKIKI